jgi:phosphate transport system permease protein
VPGGPSHHTGTRAAVAADRRAEYLLGALAVAVLALIALMLITVAVNAWPSFAANGLKWFGPGGDVVTQFRAMHANTPLPGHSVLYFRAWPLTEFAPQPVRRVLEPVVRLLAGVPSIVYGLIGILAIAPWVEQHLISNERKQSVAYVVQLAGADLTAATLILTIMILPIMVALTANALDAVPLAWREGSAALGVNRWRTIWRVSLRTARPAIAASLVLGEAIMLALVSGGRPFAANPLDGITFLFEPVQPLGATIVQEFGGEKTGPVAHTIYAIAAVLLVSAALLSFAGWAAKQPLKRYGIGV